MKKYVFTLAVIAAAVGAAKLGYPAFMRSAFCISGEVNVSRRLAKLTRAPNTMCYLILKNQGDVPVAIKQFVNPVFPLKFRLTAGDLLLADSWRDPLNLEVRINDHGYIGELQAGDIFAKYDKPVRLRASVYITADKMLGVPTLVAHGESDKGQYLFSSPAR
ncbi:MAG: hypothetical protein WC421_04555 [Elusimicrobiales bacterium]